MKNKKIMILGAGVYQYPLIKTAKAMGITSVVVSYGGKYPGFRIADEIEYIDIRDYEKVLEAAAKHQISGICTVGSDVGVKTIGYVNDALRLNGVSFDSARLANNKYEMKQAFVRSGVRCAKGIKVESVSQALDSFLTLGSDVVFKTVDSSGNRGIIHVTSEDTIESAFHECISFSRCSHIMVEEYLRGEEIGAEAFIQNGNLEYILPHRKVVIETNAPIPIGQSVPAGLDIELESDVCDQVARGIKALGIDNSAVNVDIFIEDKKSYIVEIGARAGGGACLPESVSTYFGFNHYENIINAAMGEPINFCYKTPIPNAARLLFSDKGGILSQFDTSKVKHPDLIELSLDYSLGDEIPKFVDKTHRIGHIIVKGITESDAESTVCELCSRIEIEVDSIE